MSAPDKNHRTQITIALIGLAGVLGGAVITNWDKIFPPRPTPTATASPDITPPTRADAHQDAPARPVGTTPENTVHRDDLGFSGVYAGVSTEGAVRTPVQITFERHGNAVTGHYTQNGITGSIRGTIMGNRLSYEWRWGNYAGRGITLFHGDQYQGTWGYGQSPTNGGTTAGYRQR